MGLNLVAVYGAVLKTPLCAQLATRTLDEWFKALQLNVETCYSDTVARTQVGVDDIEYEDVRSILVTRPFVHCTTCARFQRAEASCEGKYMSRTRLTSEKCGAMGQCRRAGTTRIEFDLNVHRDSGVL